MAFRDYLEDPVVYPPAGKKRRRTRKRGTETEESIEAELSVADEMPIVISLASTDVANIQSSWTTIESNLLKVSVFQDFFKITFKISFQVGVHVFLVLFESQPQMKRIFRSYRGKKHSELRLNEDLQQLVMYLISVLKKIVKYLDESRTIVKYLRRIAKKHSSPSIDLARFDPHDLAALFCNAVRETLPRNDQVSFNFCRVS